MLRFVQCYRPGKLWYLYESLTFTFLKKPYILIALELDTLSTLLMFLRPLYYNNISRDLQQGIKAFYEYFLSINNIQSE